MSILSQPPFVIGMPTETVYGLAARIDSQEGIAAIFKIKERPFFDPLIVHVHSLTQAKTLVKEWPVSADILATAFWPGPLTLVLPKADFINLMITSGLQTVAIRMPKHPLALKLIEDEGVPLAAPSANKFGKTSPTTAEHVRAEFSNQVKVIDGGPCEIGLESTVLLLKGHQFSILRPGAITLSQILKVLPSPFHYREAIDNKESPGHLKHHYMPSVPLVLIESKDFNLDEILQKLKIKKIAGSPDQLISQPVELKLSYEPSLAAREFYSELRRLAEQNPSLIYFKKTNIHKAEAWSALLDRLTRAATLVV